MCFRLLKFLGSQNAQNIMRLQTAMIRKGKKESHHIISECMYVSDKTKQDSYFTVRDALIIYNLAF